MAINCINGLFCLLVALSRPYALYVWSLCIPTYAFAADIRLEWDANKEPDIVGYRVYGRASTESVFKPITTIHKQTTATVKVDGRRSWIFYVTARNAVMESRSSNNVRIIRGY